MSKDKTNEYVKHLRSIHFFIVIVCFGIFATSIFTQMTIEKKAFEQLLKIDDVLKDWKENKEWMKDRAIDVIKSKGFKLETDKTLRYHIAFDPEKKNYINLEFKLGRKKWGVSGGDFVWLYENKDLYDWNYLADFFALYKESPSTLEEFKEFFYILYHYPMISIGIFEEIRPEEAYFARPYATRLDESEKRRIPVLIATLLEDIDFHKIHKTKVLKGQHKPNPYIFDMIFAPRLERQIEVELLKDAFSMGFYKKADWLKSIGSRSFFKKPGLLGTNLDLNIRQPVLWLFIPVKTQELRINLFKEFLKKFELNWNRAEFKTLFPELEEVTEEFQNFEINKLKTVLEKQMNRSSERFEIFNTKIPAEEVSKWGMFIILGLQLYFLFHLASFINSDFKPKEMEIPWIGIYSDKWIKRFTILSTIVLPFGMIIHLSINHLKIKIDPILLAISLVVVLCDIFFCYLTWKNLKILWDRVGH